MQIIHLDITPSADREKEKMTRGKIEGWRKREKNFFWSTFCNIKALAGGCDGAMHMQGGEWERRREDDTDAEETAPSLPWLWCGLRINSDWRLGCHGLNGKRRKEHEMEGWQQEKSMRKKRKIQQYKQVSKHWEKKTSLQQKKPTKKHADVALYSRSRNIEIKAKFSAWQYKKLNNIQSSDYSPKKASSVCPQSADYRKKEFLYWDTAFS